MKRYLLDTNALIFWLDSAPMQPDAAAIVESLEAEVLVSPVSIWEIGIKVKAGRLRVDVPIADLVRSQFESVGITDEQVERAGALPLHHRDPFDRLLIAQAQDQDLTVITRDRVFDRYDIDVVRC